MIEQELARIADALEQIARVSMEQFARATTKGPSAEEFKSCVPKVRRPKKATAPPAEKISADGPTAGPAISEAAPKFAPPVDAPVPEVAAPTPAPSVAASPIEKPPSVEEVRAVLVAVQTKLGKPRAMELLNKWTSNAGVLSKLAEQDRAGVIAEGKVLVQ